MSDPKIAFDAAKYADEVKRRDAERAHDKNDDLAKLLNEAATRDAQAAIRILLAVNGGVAAALLAFAGGLVTRSSVQLSAIAETVSNLKWFVGGLTAAAVSGVATYITNASYAGAAVNRIKIWDHPWLKETGWSRIWRYLAYVFHAIALLAAIAGFFFFIYGLFKTQQKVAHLFG